MKTSLWKIAPIFLLVLAITFLAATGVSAKTKGPGGGPPVNEDTGNCLSFPVIWAEGVTKALRGAPGAAPALTGSWWYRWGTDPEGNPMSCAPDPDDDEYCDDGLPGQTTAYRAYCDPDPDDADYCDDGVENQAKGDKLPDYLGQTKRVYLQQDADNTWQAGSADWSSAPLYVHWIDWGDNLESVDWYTRSMVRTEVVLIQDLTTPMLQYGMQHLYGWGQTEMHGIETTSGNPSGVPQVAPLDGTQATVYSHCARLVIQKLTKTRDDPTLALSWNSDSNIWEGDALPALYNEVVWEGGDGSGYYSAEINVKGKIIYGYTWNVRRLNDGPGDYRITFNLDDQCPAVLNTFFAEDITQILQPAEEEASLEAEEPTTGGAAAVLDFGNNLTYMDVRILERGGKLTKIK